MNGFLKNLKRYFIPHQENDYKPHFFALESVLVLSGVIVSLFLLVVAQHIAVLRGNNMLASVISSTLVDITNEDRAGNGKGTLAMNHVLTRAAQAKANDMAEKSYFAHNSPAGVTPWHWFEQEGYAFSYAGENLAVNFSDSIDVGDAWMKSPGHRANILNEHFTEVGIATAEGVYEGEKTVFVVQFFGKPAPVRIARESDVVVKKETRPAKKTPSEVIATATTTATTTPVEEVAGATIETVVVDDMFVAVKNSDVIEAEKTPAPMIDAPAGSLLGRLLASPKTTLTYAYLVFAILVVFALALDTFIEIRRRHPIHMVYASILWILILALLYFGGAYVFPEVIVL